jgi:tetratricopeptide (TPR) repeat protein
MTDRPIGKVVTFYSYKGGTGRTMALANVAWILAANGKRVLVVDWDLESPGLARYFAPFLPGNAGQTSPGVIELVDEFHWAKSGATDSAEQPEPAHYADVTRYAKPINWSHFPENGAIDFLGAGRQDRNYADTLSGVDWDDFYEKVDGGQFFDDMRASMQRNYDYALIDSRTGFSDVAGICTMHLPDILVDCFTLSWQGIDGAAETAHAVRDYKASIRVLPVPMRVDPAEKAKADIGRAVAKARFAGLPADLDADERDRYWDRVQVPHWAYYGYEELLAAFEDDPGVPGSMLAAYERLTAEITEGAITDLPALDPALRKQVSDQYQRRLVVPETEVTLRYAPEDRVWAEWLGQILTGAGLQVHDEWGEALSGGTRGRELMIVSQTFASNEGQQTLAPTNGQRGALAVYVAELPLIPRAAGAGFAIIAGASEPVAIEKVLTLVGRSQLFAVAATESRPRYPGDEPGISNLQARNGRFTGRENDLRELRNRLSARGSVVISALPVALQGMGGIGKTQLALEYAHRFKASYDVTWWISAGRVAFVDTQLGDLGRQMGVGVGAAPDAARAVLEALSRADSPRRRWLLIYDNAEDIEKVNEFMPSGGGHVIITSRNSAWADRTDTMQIDVFKRQESMDHFFRRVAEISVEEARRLAERLGDLPIAVAASAAWLADTGFGVADYIQQIEQRGLSAIPLPGDDNAGQDQVASLQAVWDLSLSLLQERSPGAYRLLQVCSVMDPSIGLDLIYSEQLAEFLKEYDPDVTEQPVRGKLVQALNRLALVRVERMERRPGERSGGRITIHRLVQDAVRERMDDELLDKTRHQVHLVLAGNRPSRDADDPDSWPTLRLLWPHLEASDAVGCEDESVRRLLDERIRYLWVMGDFARGLDRAVQTEARWVERLGELEVGTAEYTVLKRQLLHLRFNKANILRSLGQFQESRALDASVLEEQRELVGPQHPHTLATAGSLAGDLRSLGQYNDALERDEATHKAWRDVFGDENPRTLMALNNVATSYRLIGDFRRALELDELAYLGRQNLLGDRHPQTLQSAGHIGRDLREAGEYQRSVILLRSVAQLYETVTREALNAKANLAISLRSAGDAKEAAKLLDDAYDQLRREMPLAPDTLACRLSRAVNLLALGDPSAEEELSKVLDQYKEDLGEAHPHAIVCLNNLAIATRADGRISDAAVLAEQAARLFEESLGSRHPYTVGAETNFAVCLAEAGRSAEALAILDDATRRAVGVLGEEHPDTLRCYANQAMIRHRNGDEQAEDVIREVEQRLAGRIGDRHPSVLSMRQRHLLDRIIDPQPF